MHALMDGRDNVRFALSAAPGMDAWYAEARFRAGHPGDGPPAPAALTPGGRAVPARGGFASSQRRA